MSIAPAAPAARHLEAAAKSLPLNLLLQFAFFVARLSRVPSSPLKAISLPPPLCSLPRSRPSSAIIPLRYDILLSFGATHENGRTDARTGRRRSQSSRCQRRTKNTSPSLSRGTHRWPHRTDPSLPFKKCAKFNLIRSPDSDRPLPSLPIQLLFLSPFRGPPRFTSLHCRDDSTFSQTDCCRSNWGSAAAATPSPHVGAPIVAMIAALAATASQADEVSLSLADMHARKPSESQKGRDPLSRFFPPSPTMPRSPVLAFLDKCA